eukprot:1980248-Amphidinium_carterae.2
MGSAGTSPSLLPELGARSLALSLQRRGLRERMRLMVAVANLLQLLHEPNDALYSTRATTNIFLTSSRVPLGCRQAMQTRGTADSLSA